MKRIVWALALVTACGLMASTAYAGPGCCKSKTAQATCTASNDFPKLVRLVGDKEIGCPEAAAKMAKESNSKIVYVVAGEKYDCEQKAMTALAVASEDYVQKFTSIACVGADGKVMYCGDKGSKSCGSTESASLVKSGSSCHSKAVGASMAKTEGSSCNKTREASMVKAESKSGCSKGEATVAKAEGASCHGKGGAASASLAKADSKPGCCMSKGAAMASAESCKNMKGVKFMVAGRTFEKYEDAEKAHDEAVAAIKKVSIQYMVDGKKVECASQVCPKAKADGKVQYVVCETKTNCEVEARINLAKAQYDVLKQSDKKVAKL